MQRCLLLGGRERPGGLAAALLAEHEAQLARRAQALRAVGPEGRARLVELERAEAVAREEALFTRDLAALGAARGGGCGQPSRTPSSRLRHRTAGMQAQLGDVRKGKPRPGSAKRRVFEGFPQIARNRLVFPLLAGRALRILRGFGARTPGKIPSLADARHRSLGLRRRRARAAAAARRPSGPRVRPLPAARRRGRRAARRPRAGRRHDRRGPRAGARRRRGGLLPHPLDGRPGGQRVRGARADPGAPIRRRGREAGVRRIVYLGGIVPRRRPHLPAPGLAARGGGGAAGRGTGVDRLPRLDRGRPGARARSASSSG